MEKDTANEVNKPRVAAICGVKNSGKTTLLVRLVRYLTERGLRVAVIKHDGHDFTCDVPGTDSWRFAEAGACGTAVYSAERMFVHRKTANTSVEDLISQFPEADLILLEGQKESTWPKIEVIRSAISDQPASNPEGRFLIVTDCPPGTFQESTLPFEALEEIANRLLENLYRSRQ